MDRIKEKISDGRVLSLIEMFLQQSVLDDCKRWTLKRVVHNAK